MLRPAPPAAAIDLRAVLGIGVDDGRAVGRQQLGEEAQLGGEIGLHGRVIVEMVAAEIGEGGSLQAHAVEPVLVEAVRGGLEGQMRDALDRQLRQCPVQGHRVWRRQSAISAAVGLDQADGAQRGGLVPEGGEDLPGEFGDRGLAAGARYGDDGFGLGRVEPRGHQGQRPARLGGGKHGHILRHVDLRPVPDENGGGPLGDGLRHEARAVGLGAGNGGKQPAGLHLAAIGGDAGDCDIPACCARRGRLGTQQ